MDPSTCNIDEVDHLKKGSPSIFKLNFNVPEEIFFLLYTILYFLASQTCNKDNLISRLHF